MTDGELRILVVDDEAPIRRFLRAALSAHNYVIFEAGNGRAAIDAMIADRPDLIILDLGLPDMDGIDVTRQLREWTTVPIIVMSVPQHETDKMAELYEGAIV